MTIAIRIFLEIVLMVFLGRVEILKRKDFYGDWFGVLCGLMAYKIRNYRKVLIINVINPCTIPSPFVVPLSV